MATSTEVGRPVQQTEALTPRRDPGTGRPTTQIGKLKDATSILSESTLAKASSLNLTTSQITKAVKDLWSEQKAERGRTKTLSAQCTAEDLRRAQHPQTEEVFAVLASLGELLLALEVFDAAFYPQALADTLTSLYVGGLDPLETIFEKQPTEIQFSVTAAMVFCAFFYPMHIYRGYGAALLENWDWGCPDLEALERDKVKEQGSWISRLGKGKPVVQENQAVLEAFDRAILSLQGKSHSKDFLARKPPISGLVASHPRFGKKEKKDVKKELELLEDFTKEIQKRGYPGPANITISTWAMPFATWRSKFSCNMVKSWEDVMMLQMDPGRLLHAYLNRSVLSLTDAHLVVLPPGTLAETLACWLEGLPGTDHKIVRWANLETEVFEKKMRKASKEVWRKLDQYPLPNIFVMKGRDVPKRSITTITSSTLASPRSPISSVSTEADSRVVTPPAQSVSQRTSRAERPVSDAAPPPPYASASPAQAIAQRATVAFSPDQIGVSSPPEPDEQLNSKNLASHILGRGSDSLSPGSPMPIKRKPAPHREASQSSRMSAGPSVSEEVSIADGMRYDNLSSPVSTQAVSENYLHLLNDVAHGRITPQQLQEILQQGAATHSSTYVAEKMGSLLTSSVDEAASTAATSSVTGVATSPAPQPQPVPAVEKDSRELSVPWGISDGAYLPVGSAVFEMPTERDPVETDGQAVDLPRGDHVGVGRSSKADITAPSTSHGSSTEAASSGNGEELASPSVEATSNADAQQSPLDGFTKSDALSAEASTA